MYIGAQIYQQCPQLQLKSNVNDGEQEGNNDY
jgi:hypothetical protein